MKNKKQTAFLALTLIFIVAFSWNLGLNQGPGVFVPSQEQTRPMPTTNHTTAMNGDTSTASVPSFAQTNPSAADSSFWPDGYNNSLTNTYDRYNMAGIGNWVSYNIGAGESKGTSGDYGWLKVHPSGADHWVGMYSNRPSFSAASLGNTYIEIRFWANCTGQAAWRVSAYTLDSLGGTGWVIKDLTQIANTWTTYRASLPNTNALECLSIQIELTTGQPPLEFRCDYLLLTPSTMGGWQHDCSDIGNISGSALHMGSDGHIITFDATPGYSPQSFTFKIDNTATKSGLNPAMYPFWQVSVTQIYQQSPDWSYSFTGCTATQSYTLVSATTAGPVVYTRDLYALSSSDWYNFTITVALGTSTYSWVRVDFMTVYGIANFTTTITGAGVNDVAYVSSNALQVTKSSATLFQFAKDQTVSIAYATYNKWNISTSAGPSAVGISLYNGTWNTKDYQTAGVMPAGTTTRFILRVFSTCTISAVKFITWFFVTNTIWSSVSPTSPTTITPVVLKAVVTNSSALYAVYFHPISYPAGFSSSDYRATYQQLNLWNYTFSSLPLAGDYSFAVIGSTGSQNTSLGSNSYITFYVALATIQILTVTLSGQSSEFQQMQWSFYSNMAATLTIYEGLSQSSMTATHTVSVITGLNGIAWSKFNAPNSMVYVNATFSSGSLSTMVPMFYAVAPTIAQQLKWLSDNITHAINNLPVGSSGVRLLGFYADQGTMAVIFLGAVPCAFIAYLMHKISLKKAIAKANAKRH